MSRSGSAGVVAAFALACLAAWSWLLWKGPWYAQWPVYVPLVVAVVAGVIADWIRMSAAPRRAWTAGLLLFVVGGLAVGLGAGSASSAHAGYPEARSAWEAVQRADAGAEAGAGTAGERQSGALADRVAFFAARGAPAQSQVGLANTLWGLTLLSGLLFFVLLIVKPERAAVGSTLSTKNLWEPWR